MPKRTANLVNDVEKMLEAKFEAEHHYQNMKLPCQTNKSLIH